MTSEAVETSALSGNAIDKLGERLRAGNIDAETLRRLESFRALHAHACKSVETVLVDRLGLQLTWRPSKSTVAIIEKLRRESIRLNQIQDIAGCRVVVDGLRYQDRLLHAMSIMLGDVRIDDKREAPQHGYRAVHVIARFHGRPVEIQLRTHLQHVWANISEKVADDVGHSVKYGVGDAAALDFLQSLSIQTARLELIRKERDEIAEQIQKSGKSYELHRARKAINEKERACLSRIRAIFARR